MASNGNGALLHLAGELFKMMTGVDMQVIWHQSGSLASRPRKRLPTIPESFLLRSRCELHWHATVMKRLDRRAGPTAGTCHDATGVAS
jgi:hypothetical protein